MCRPCYIGLKNNVSTIEMEMACQRWKPETAEFVPHHVMADYIQDSAIDNGIIDSISFSTRVNSVRKVGKRWEVGTSRLSEAGGTLGVTESTEASNIAMLFDIDLTKHSISTLLLQPMATIMLVISRRYQA